ncbi:helix-turn-helix domain-containing protein [Streptomyces pini]|nr:helix-turn-helix transcriptional regulator [Streptomyces pini]
MPVPEPAPQATDLPPWRLVSTDRLRIAMERTGTGRKITTRELAAAAGVSHGTIGSLSNGTRRDVPFDVAPRIARVLGVDTPFLFELTGRAVPAESDTADEYEVVPA